MDGCHYHTVSVYHLKSPGFRQRPDLTGSILTNKDLRYNCYDAQMQIKRTEANKNQKEKRHTGI